MKSELKLHSHWRYIGDGPGQGGIMSLASIEPHELVLISTSHAWLGDAAQFRKDFRAA